MSLLDKITSNIYKRPAASLSSNPTGPPQVHRNRPQTLLVQIDFAAPPCTPYCREREGGEERGFNPPSWRLKLEQHMLLVSNFGEGIGGWGVFCWNHMPKP